MVGETPAEEQELLSLDLIFSEVKERLAVQVEQVSSLDTKISVLLGAIGIMFAALFPTSPQLPIAPRAFLLLGTLALFLSFLQGLLAYGLRQLDRPPDPRSLRMGYIKEHPTTTKLSLVDTLVVAFERNQLIIENKIRQVKLAFRLFFSGAVLMTIALGIVLWN